MKKFNRWWLFSGLIVLIAILAFSVPAFASGTANDIIAAEPFYGVSGELTGKLEGIALANTEIQSLINGSIYVLSANGQSIIDNNYILSVGVRIKDDITEAQFSKWVNEGRQDSDLVTEYVGVLNIGYNDRYLISFDKEKEVVSEIVAQKGYRTIPEVTQEEEQRALDIAFRDQTVSQLLTGKEFRIAPDNKIGVWHEGAKKLGISFQVEFTNSYTIDSKLPNYNSADTIISGDVDAVIIDILLDENRVATIIPRSPILNGGSH